MEKSTFFLNPNATPFIPNFKRSIAADDERTQEVPVDEAFNSLSTEEFPGRGHHQNPKSEDTNPQFADPEIDLDGLEFGLEFLSSLFPNFSMESIADVFHACGDVFGAESMLKKLEGIESSSDSLSDGSDSHGTASSSHQFDRSSAAASPPDTKP